MASVRERAYAGGVFWEAWYQDRRGKRRAFNTKIAVQGERSRQAALELTLAVQMRVQAGGSPFAYEQGPRSLKPLFAGLWKKFVEEKRLTVRRGTAGLYEQTARAWLSCMDNLPVGEIGRGELQLYAERRLKQAGKAGRMRAETVNRELRDMRSFLRWCQRQGLVERVPTVLQLKTEPKRPAVYRPDEVRALFAAGAAYRLHGVRFDLFLRVLLFSALRVSEAVALEWSDVDAGRRRLTIGGARTKTGRMTEVPLSLPLVQTLREWPKPRRGRLFQWSADSGYLRKLWARVCADAGVRYQKLHSWRHAGATMMVEAGLKPHQLQQILHASLATTLKYYVSADADAVRDAARRIGKSKYGRV